ncbi:MAG: alkane 1-monooxygenase, partial [Pseudarthrobacter sp.]|nr:alkane 1-monooxygenase [Pseudarthrobacter sp.]
TKRARVSLCFGGGREFSDDEADMILDSPQGQHVAQMMRYSAVGTPDVVMEYLAEFGKHADADELIVAHQSTGTEGRLRSVELLAQAAGLVAV